MTSIHRILSTTALCLVALVALVANSCQSSFAANNSERYVNGLPRTPELEAELEQTSRRLLNELQSSASQSKDVRLVIDWTRELGDRLQGTEVPLSADEKTELLHLIDRMQPVKIDLDMDITKAYVLELQFIMPDGSTKTYPYPSVARLSSVSADGYASMSYFALTDAEAERWNKLAKHEWVWQRIEQAQKQR